MPALGAHGAEPAAPPALLSPRPGVTAFCISAFKTAPARQREEVGVAASPDSAHGGSGWGGCRNAALGDVTRGWGTRSNPTAGVPRIAYGVTPPSLFLSR